MSQPKSNEEIITDYYNNFPECPQDLIGCTLDQEDVDEFNRARKRGEDWLRTILAQKDAEVAEAVKAQAEADQKAFQHWVETRLPVILQESIDHALTHPTKQTED